MQWILDSYEDTDKLADAPRARGRHVSKHKVIPFVGDLTPAPEIADPSQVVLFGAYSLWRYAEKHELSPGVFRISPFVHEIPWQPFMLNGPDALIMPLRDIPQGLPNEDRLWFMRPVADSKEEPGRVWHAKDIHTLAQKVLNLPKEHLISGSLGHDTFLMFTPPRTILREWRIWVVADQVVTWSLYKQGTQVTYQPEITPQAKEFALDMVARNPGYAPAYVIDICETDAGLHLLETNCLNAAGFYAADLGALIEAIEAMPRA
jgi:hypothetical protein